MERGGSQLQTNSSFVCVFKCFREINSEKRSACVCNIFTVHVTSVQTSAVLKRGCDVCSFTSKIKKAWWGDSVCQALGNMISIHCNAIAHSLLPKVKSPFCPPSSCYPLEKKIRYALVHSRLRHCCPEWHSPLSCLFRVSFLLEFESSQVTEKKRTVYQMALSKRAHVCQWMFAESPPLFLTHLHQVCPFPHIVSFILLLSIFLFHCCMSPSLFPPVCLSFCLSLFSSQIN